MNSGDVDENGIPDGAQYGCEQGSTDDEIDVEEQEDEEGGEEPEEEDESGIFNIRDDPLSRPRASFLFWLMVISAVCLGAAAATMFIQPRRGTDEILIDD